MQSARRAIRPVRHASKSFTKIEADDSEWDGLEELSQKLSPVIFPNSYTDEGANLYESAVVPPTTTVARKERSSEPKHTPERANSINTVDKPPVGRWADLLRPTAGQNTRLAPHTSASVSTLRDQQTAQVAPAVARPKSAVPPSFSQAGSRETITSIQTNPKTWSEDSPVTLSKSAKRQDKKAKRLSEGVNSTPRASEIKPSMNTSPSAAKFLGQEENKVPGGNENTSGP